MIRVRHQRAMTLYCEELGMQIAPYSDKALERGEFQDTHGTRSGPLPAHPRNKNK